LLWVDHNRTGRLINRVVGSAITLTGTTKATAPTGDIQRALEFSSPISLGSVSLPAAGTLLLWVSGTVAVTIGGVAVTLTDHGTALNTFTLKHATAGGAKSGAIVLTPTGTAKIFDMRIFSKTLSSDARTYYYTDSSQNNGKKVVFK
jgi:hypothetical protein